MAAQITSEIMVGLTEKIREGIEVACACNGMKPSASIAGRQYSRNLSEKA